MGKTAKQLLAIFMICTLLLPFAGCTDKDGKEAVLYFLNATGNKLETEERNVEKQETPGAQASTVLIELLKGPSRPDLLRSVPENVRVLSVDVAEEYATVNFSKEFQFKTEIDRVFAQVAVVSTLTAIPGIERVKILVDGEDLRSFDGKVISAMSSDDIVYDSQLVVADYKFVKLYFSNRNADGLLAESRTVAVNAKDSIEYVLVSELIKGPKTDYTYKTIPEDTKILSVETKDGTCFVNLSQEFKSKHWGGSSGETMTIFSVVNTLTELDTVQKVQFLIEGKKVDSFIHYIFNEPFERNEDIISHNER